MKGNFLPAILALAFLAGCAKDAHVADTKVRPLDPWVVRSVLDSVPRMITLALDDNLWVAYNTGKCGISKAWKGYVDYEGAVYTTAHGPQPLTVGDFYLVDTIQSPWQIYQGDKPVATSVQYYGHRIKDGHAQLMYNLNATGLQTVRVNEQVEYLDGDKGQPGLERVFTVENLPDGYQVHLHTEISSIVSRRNIECDGSFEVNTESSRPLGTLQIMDLDGILSLRSEKPTRLVTWFVNRPSIPNGNAASVSEDISQPLGMRLIDRNDCRTCHNEKLRTIGPAYQEVALRYENNEETVSRLVQKVIKGGAGIWGAQVMSPHPELSESDATEMVRYVLSLDTMEAKGGAQTSQDIGDYLKPTEGLNEEALFPGAVTKVYIHQTNLNKIPTHTGKPQMAGVMSAFDNMEGADFVDLTDNFSIQANGYLRIPERGVYTFQLWSDDGSRLTLNGEVIIDHDGPHGTTAKEKAVGLEKGYYPYTLDYYQGAGGRFLSLDWKRPGSESYEVIPASVYAHTEKQRDATQGLSLPMSAVSMIPGDRFALEGVHPSFDVFQARPYDFLPKVGGMDFMDDGTLVICTWDPKGAVYLLRNVTAENPADIQVKQIASGLAEPLGLKVVDNEIYVLQKQELTKLVDTDGDDLIDEFINVSNQWHTSGNFHEFAFGLAYRDGYFYANLATAIQPGGASVVHQIQDRGKVMKISKENGSVEFLASGLRTPNGIGWGVDDELFVADNQGDWLPSSKILHVSNGAWFGSRSVDFEGTAGLTEKPPVVWLPQDEIGNSPSTPGLLKDGPYAGQMMHGEVTHGGLKRVFVEKVNGEYQGAVFRFTQGLEAGINRLVYGPDGSIYVGGIGNPGNWAHAGGLWYGLQRLKYNGKPTFEMLAVRAKTDGIEIEFTQPLKEGDGWSASDYDIRQWKYVPTKDYGGPKVDDKPMKVTSAHVSADHKRVFLAIPGLEEGHVVYVHLNNRFISKENQGLWSTEAWYTLNHIPQGTPGERTQPPGVYANNTLTSEEEAGGWKLLFDGKTLDGWRNYGQETRGPKWIIRDESIYLDASKGAEEGGDILTDGEYENFELTLEWKISNCGNSGIIYNVVESDDYPYPWSTGPEMQVLDNSCHPDARYQTHKAGDLYDLIECTYVTVKPAGSWNKIRIIKKDGHLEHWLNGVKVVSCEMYSDRWAEMIAASKFKDMQGFGQAKKGKIALQDHGDPVWFRNIKIRTF